MSAYYVPSVLCFKPFVCVKPWNPHTNGGEGKLSAYFKLKKAIRCKNLTKITQLENGKAKVHTWTICRAATEAFESSVQASSAGTAGCIFFPRVEEHLPDLSHQVLVPWSPERDCLHHWASTFSPYGPVWDKTMNRYQRAHSCSHSPGLCAS